MPRHRAIAHSDIIFVAVYVQVMMGEKCFADSLRKYQPMLILTYSLYHGLNQTMFRFFAFLLTGPELLTYCNATVRLPFCILGQHW